MFNKESSDTILNEERTTKLKNYLLENNLTDTNQVWNIFNLVPNWQMIKKLEKELMESKIFVMEDCSCAKKDVWLNPEEV